jgi:hypothetical protein|tara:strand:- start:379 stop:987 length:609 start_codon:yes stop_codon:yes gene_type:complete
MNEGSEMEGQLIKCKHCNNQWIHESRTKYLENRLAELNKDLDDTENKINLKKKEHHEKINQLQNDLKNKTEEFDKQVLLQEKVVLFESRLKNTDKINSEELELGNEINKIQNKIKKTSENILTQNNDIEKKTNYIETKITSYKNEHIEKENKHLNQQISENDSSEIININKNLSKSEKYTKNQSEDNKKIKKFRFFSPGFIK